MATERGRSVATARGLGWQRRGDGVATARAGAHGGGDGGIGFERGTFFFDKVRAGLKISPAPMPIILSQ
jgi:hypothetical protein